MTESRVTQPEALPSKEELLRFAEGLPAGIKVSGTAIAQAVLDAFKAGWSRRAALQAQGALQAQEPVGTTAEDRANPCAVCGWGPDRGIHDWKEGHAFVSRWAEGKP